MLTWLLVLTWRVNRRALYSTFDRVWGGLSDTAKAFIIIASTPRTAQNSEVLDLIPRIGLHTL